VSLSLNSISLILSIILFIVKIINDIDLFYINLNDWISIFTFELNYGFIIDFNTIIMLIIVSSISFLVHLYSFSYMSDDTKLKSFIAYLSLFTFFMFILISANNFVLFFIGWEGVGLCSYLLISFWYTRYSAYQSAMKAIIVNRIGDFFLLIAIGLIFYLFNDLNFVYVMYNLNFHNADFIIFDVYIFDLIALFLTLAAVGKSAQIGLHTWLPDAMEGPTPVSALIHAATMVTAGIFLIIRCSSLFENANNILSIITFLGAITSFIAATIGLLQNDIKKIIAYSTCSQLGYMFAICGLSYYSLSLFHLFNHAFFKALLFLVAGAIIHSLNNEQDIRQMGNLFFLLPLAYVSLIIGSLALMGIPFFFFFYSKDIILEFAYITFFIDGLFVFWFCIVAAFFTTFYSFRLFFFVFYLKTDYSVFKSFLFRENNFLINIVLYLLILSSIFFGYAFSEYFLNFSYDFFLLNQYSNILNFSNFSFLHQSFFYMPFYIKILPLIFSGLSIFLFYFIFLKFDFNFFFFKFRYVFVFLFIICLLFFYLFYVLFLCFYYLLFIIFLFFIYLFRVLFSILYLSFFSQFLPYLIKLVDDYNNFYLLNLNNIFLNFLLSLHLKFSNFFYFARFDFFYMRYFSFFKFIWSLLIFIKMRFWISFIFLLLTQQFKFFAESFFSSFIFIAFNYYFNLFFILDSAKFIFRDYSGNNQNLMIFFSFFLSKILRFYYILFYFFYLAFRFLSFLPSRFFHYYFINSFSFLNNNVLPNFNKYFLISRFVLQNNLTFPFLFSKKTPSAFFINHSFLFLSSVLQRRHSLLLSSSTSQDLIFGNYICCLFIFQEFDFFFNFNFGNNSFFFLNSLIPQLRIENHFNPLKFIPYFSRCFLLIRSLFFFLISKLQRYIFYSFSFLKELIWDFSEIILSVRSILDFYYWRLSVFFEQYNLDFLYSFFYVHFKKLSYISRFFIYFFQLFLNFVFFFLFKHYNTTNMFFDFSSKLSLFFGSSSFDKVNSTFFSRDLFFDIPYFNLLSSFNSLFLNFFDLNYSYFLRSNRWTVSKFIIPSFLKSFFFFFIF